MKLFRLSCLLLLLALGGTAFGSTRGKIAGVIREKYTAQPIPDVNVYLKDTDLGATTDRDGFFVLLNVEPGKYTLVVEHLGYTTLQVENLRVAVNLTTELNLELEQAAIESREAVTITAERPLIRPDVTSRLAVIDGEQINALPVENFIDVVASQAGITTDAQGNLHFRGGRVNEVAYLVDGQRVEDPIDKSVGGLIDNYAIRELQVLSGTFNAEYGSAMSGIVNIVTNDGSDRFSAKFQYRSAMLNDSPYRKTNALVPDANPIYDKQTGARLTYQAPDAIETLEPALPIEGSLRGTFSGPLPGAANFFVSGEYGNENSWLPYGYNFLRSGFGKLSFPIASHKLSLSLQYTGQEYQPYDHRFKYLPDTQGHWENESIRYGLQYNHVFSPRSYLVLNASLLDVRSLYRVDGLDYTQYVFPELDENQEFVYSGNSRSYSDIKSLSYNFKGDWLYQLGASHEFKSGFEVNLYDLEVFDYTNEGNNADEFFLNEYQKKPVNASIYFQDKIEYSTLIINAGLRGDYVDVKAEGYQNIENPQEGLVSSDPEFKISPRLGLAYPISENTVLHFSYGQFFQFPNFQDIYRNLQFLNVDELAKARLALVANPNVKSQKTIAYEFGVSQKLGTRYALNVTAYSRDMTDLLGTVYVETLYRYAIFTNNDFARIQGIDVSLEKRMSDFWAARLDYTYSVARGNEATPTEEALNIFEGREKSVKELYLDFDRTHDVALNFLLQFPRGFGFSLFGVRPLQQLNFSVLAQFSSGLPYTPISDDRTKTFEKNSARMPWTNSVDIRLEKFFPVSRASLSVFLEVTNLFDRLNPLIVQPRTGKVWNDGKSRLFGSGQDFMHDPSDVGPPRIVKLGLTMGM